MMMKYFPHVIVATFLVFQFGLSAPAQIGPSAYIDNSGQLNYSSLDWWYSRKVKESSVLSGQTIDLYGVGKVSSQSDFFDMHLRDSSSPWGTTNIFSKMVMDIGNTRVTPEKRDNGYCARLETKIRKDNIVGIHLEVLIAGTLFLGELVEPVKGLKDPEKNVSQGIPFNKKPQKVMFDYKYHVGEKCIKATYGKEPVEGADKAEFCIILQKRWEDKNGNVFATRVGGNRVFFTGKQEDWINSAEFPVYYGDATHLPQYDSKIMGLIPEVAKVYVYNSKQKLVPLIETGWGTKDDIPTHMIMYFTSSYRGIQYIGSDESTLWVDNIKFIY
ncbi:MAG: PCMD domain-containing protein [Draconibacterium sp.]